MKMFIPVLVALLLLPACSFLQNKTKADDCAPFEGTIQVTDDTSQTTMMELARITPDEARAAALTAAPGFSVTSIELDEEDGYLVYEVDLRQDRVEYDVVVDAGSGDVLCSVRD